MLLWLRVKLTLTLVVVNGEKNPLSITLQNLGKKNYTLVSAAASYHDPNNHWALVSRLSVQ